MEMPSSVEKVLADIGLQKRRHVSDLILGSFGIFAAGILVGGVLGLLFAPKLGCELRGDIQDKLHKVSKEVQDGAERVRSSTT